MSRPLPRDVRGAVYVEFLIAFLPFFVFFLCLWQVTILYYTKLMVDHAALAAARAAAVIVAESSNRVDPNGGPSSVNELTGSRAAFVRSAAEIALAPLILDGTIFEVNVMYPAPNTPGGADSMEGKTYAPMGQQSASLMRVQVQAMMYCKIAFANAIMCPPTTTLERIDHLFQKWFLLPVVAEAVFPYQGASYTYDPSDDKNDGSNGPALVPNPFPGH